MTYDGATVSTRAVSLPFRSTEHVIPQDWCALATYLSNQGATLDLEASVRQFAGGFGNLNYLVTIDEIDWVLRRPPLGPIPPGANDMAREHRMLAALHSEWPLAPKPFVFCDDLSVLGAPFLLIEYRPGLIIGGDLPPGIATPVVGSELSSMLVEVLASFHSIDPKLVGLSAFGRPEGFLDRAVAGWSKRADLALNGGDRPVAMCAVMEWLQRQPVPQGGVTLLHNDFKLDNVILDPETRSPRAVIDWDMGSRGDPLFDLATLLSYWCEPDDPPCMHRLAQMPTARPGFWSRADVVEAYARATGRDVSDFAFYRILTMFKLAVVFLQLEARQRASEVPDARLAALAGLGDELMTFTCELLHGGRDLGGAL